MTTEERKIKKAELYKMYSDYFTANKINPYFITKTIRKEGNGEQYTAASFFENEFNVTEKYGEVYVVNVNWRDMSPSKSDDFSLYKWTYNPYWNDPSEGYEKIVINSNGNTFTKYAIPIEEFTVVGKGVEFWKSFGPKKEPELPLFDMSSISGVKPKHEPIEASTAFSEAIEDEGMDTLVSKLTAKDLYALVHRKPISSIPDINQFINRENNI